ALLAQRRALHTAGRLAGRPPGRRHAAGDDEDDGGHDQRQRAVAGRRGDGPDRQRQRDHEPQEAAVRQRHRPPRDQPGHGPPGLRAGRAARRRDSLIGTNPAGAAVDDPDAYFYENYKCGTSRNYTDYCSEQTDRLIDQQSQELDRDKRMKLVWEIQRRLESDVARPMLGWRNEYFTQWPYVRNLVPHHSLYNYGRMQDVWLDRY